MSNLRALLVALTIIAMVIAPVLVSFVGMGSPSGLSAYAAVVAAPAMQDDDDDDDSGNDDEDGNNDGDDGNNDGVDGDDDDGPGVNNNGDDDDDGGGNDDDGNGGGNDDDGGDNDNNGGGDDDGGDDDGGDDDGPASPFVPGYRPPSAPAQPSCSTPGQQSSFTSSDGTVSVTVYAGMPQGVRFRIRKPVDPGSVPAVPGQRVDALLFELIAETCDGQPLAKLPGEVNLGVRYTDGDAAGLNEANFKIARLDQSDNTWKDTAKQAPDPGANFVSATITDLGYYVVHVP